MKARTRQTKKRKKINNGVLHENFIDEKIKGSVRSQREWNGRMCSEIWPFGIPYVARVNASMADGDRIESMLF